MDLFFPPLLVILAFSALNEAILEYLFGNVRSLAAYLPLLGLGAAIFLSFTYQLTILSDILGVQSNFPVLDYLFSGFIISRVSNFINDLAQRVLRSK